METRDEIEGEAWLTAGHWTAGWWCKTADCTNRRVVRAVEPLRAPEWQSQASQAHRLQCLSGRARDAGNWQIGLTF